MLVSVVIPCYNAGRWVELAVESALAQKGVAVEVIAVENGSTDETRDVLRSFGDRIRYVSMEPLGGNAARNQGLAMARGEWVQFLDADDALVPGKIATQLAEAGSALSSCDMLYAPVLVETWRDDACVAVEPTFIDPAFDKYQQWFAWQLPQTGGALWRTEALRHLGGWNNEQPCCQEHELYARALRGGFRFYETKTPGALYRIWSEETLCRRDPVQVIEVKTALFDNMVSWMQGQGLWQKRHQRVAGQACLEMARTLSRYDRDKAIGYYKDRLAKGLIHLAGPAAPRMYRAVYRCAGFRVAEAFAAWRRGKV